MPWDKHHSQWSCNKPRKDCGCPHNSFWLTVTTSPQWAAWEEEVIRRMRAQDPAKKMKGVWDVVECASCGWISPAHFQDFMAFCKTRKAKK